MHPLLHTQARELERSRGQRPSEQAALQLLGQGLALLRYMHCSGLVHMDIKPQNILVDGSGAYALADFGASCPVGAGNCNGTITPCYAAPEVLRNRMILPSPAADMWVRLRVRMRAHVVYACACACCVRVRLCVCIGFVHLHHTVRQAPTPPHPWSLPQPAHPIATRPDPTSPNPTQPSPPRCPRRPTPNPS